MNHPWLIPGLGVALLLIGAALLIVLAVNARGPRRSGTSRPGGGVYRSANAAGRRIGGGR